MLFFPRDVQVHLYPITYHEHDLEIKFKFNSIQFNNSDNVSVNADVESKKPEDPGAVDVSARGYSRARSRQSYTLN